MEDAMPTMPATQSETKVGKYTLKGINRSDLLQFTGELLYETRWTRTTAHGSSDEREIELSFQLYKTKAGNYIIKDESNRVIVYYTENKIMGGEEFRELFKAIQELPIDKAWECRSKISWRDKEVIE